MVHLQLGTLTCIKSLHSAIQNEGQAATSVQSSLLVGTSLGADSLGVDPNGRALRCRLRGLRRGECEGFGG